MFIQDQGNLMGERFSGGIGNHTATAYLHAPYVRLESVSFEIPAPIKEDEGQQPQFVMPQWQDSNLDGDVSDANDRRLPVAQIAGSALQVREVRFKAELGGLTPQNIEISGFGDDGVAFLDAAVYGDDALFTQGATTSEINLPNSIDVDDEFTMEWEVSFTGPGNQTLTFTSPEIDIQLYRYRTATPGAHCHTVWDIACRGSQPLDLATATEQDIIDRVWAHFTDRDVRRVSDDAQMKYYGSWLCQAITTSELIRDADGQCTSWANLMHDALKIHGISRDIVQIVGNEAVQVTEFMVKAWTLGQPSGESPNARFPYINTPDDPLFNANLFMWLYHEVQDQIGIAGQGNANPLSLFGSHILVEGAGESLYDPSYGVLHNSLAALELGANASMAGFALTTSLDEGDIGIDLNGDGSADDVGVPVYLIGTNPGGATAQPNLIRVGP